MARIMQKPRTGIPIQRQPVSFPEKLGKRLNDFLLDELSGNVQIHIRDGQILGMKVEEHLSVSP